MTPVLRVCCVCALLGWVTLASWSWGCVRSVPHSLCGAECDGGATSFVPRVRVACKPSSSFALLVRMAHAGLACFLLHETDTCESSLWCVLGLGAFGHGAGVPAHVASALLGSGRVQTGALYERVSGRRSVIMLVAISSGWWPSTRRVSMDTANFNLHPAQWLLGRRRIRCIQRFRTGAAERALCADDALCCFLFWHKRGVHIYDRPMPHAMSYGY